MLISDSHEFIFVHNYKVAGSSIKHALKTYAQTAFERLGWVQRQCARLRLREIPTYPAHLTAREIQSDHPDEWRRYFTFGFVRNPWAWQVSLYFYMLETEDHHQHDLISSMDGFDEYIHWRVNSDKHLQSEFFCDAEGRVLVDSIGRLESIQDDFQAICERVGVDVSLPHKNSSSHSGYRMYYTDDTRQLVREHFEEDIERFGYTFDGVAESSSGAESMR